LGNSRDLTEKHRDHLYQLKSYARDLITAHTAHMTFVLHICMDKNSNPRTK